MQIHFLQLTISLLCSYILHTHTHTLRQASLTGVNVNLLEGRNYHLKMDFSL